MIEELRCAVCGSSQVYSTASIAARPRIVCDWCAFNINPNLNYRKEATRQWRTRP